MLFLYRINLFCRLKSEQATLEWTESSEKGGRNQTGKAEEKAATDSEVNPKRKFRKSTPINEQTEKKQIP